MLLPSGNNPFKCHEEVLYLQPMIPPTKRFDISPPDDGGCSEGLDAFRLYLNISKRLDGITCYYVRLRGSTHNTRCEGYKIKTGNF